VRLTITRTSVEAFLLWLIYALSLGYATEYARDTVSARHWIALAIFGLLALFTVFTFRRYRTGLLQIARGAWPLWTYFLLLCSTILVFHRETFSFELIGYMVVSGFGFVYLAHCMSQNEALLVSWIKVNAVVAVVLLPTILVGMAGIDVFMGIPIVVKSFYASYTGIRATGGALELAETLGTQMAIAIPCAWCMYRRSGHWSYLLVFSAAVFGLVVSQSRGAYAAIYVALAISYLATRISPRPSIKLASIVGLIVAPYLAMDLMSQVDFLANWLRLDLGMSGREGGWEFASELVASEPFVGHGFQQSSELTVIYDTVLHRMGFRAAGASFHNTFISKAVDSGLIVAFSYVMLFVVPILRDRELHPDPVRVCIRTVSVVVLVSALFKDMNIGGVRSIALSTTIFLGLANVLGGRDRLLRRQSSARVTRPEYRDEVVIDAPREVVTA